MSLAPRRLVLVVALASSALTWLVWGSVWPAPAIHDELAYELQCRIFATGAWTAPSPPLPEFFQQFYVFSVPAVASKYWPVHSLLMAPGCLIGLPALVPVLFAGIGGGLFLYLGLALTTRPWAIVAWALWITCPVALEFRASYLSPSTTTVLFLGSLAFFHRWTSSGRTRDVLACVACVALNVGARPLTAVCLGAPVIWALMARLFVERRRKATLWAGVVAVACLSLIPLWSLETLGRVNTTPYSEYARQFFPFDRPGFSFDGRQPGVALPPDMAEHGRSLGAYFEAHTWRHLPQTAMSRLSALGDALFGGWRLILLPMVVAGISAAMASQTLRAAGTGVVLLFVGHLGFAHPPTWTLYYMEAVPILCLVASLGASRTVALATRRWDLRLDPAMRAGGALALLALVGADIWTASAHRARWQANVMPAWSAIGAIPAPAIVFVRYRPGWNLAFGLVQNPVGPDRARLWVARDLGPRNDELRAAAPTRDAYTYDTGSGRLEKLQ